MNFVGYYLAFKLPFHFNLFNIKGNCGNQITIKNFGNQDPKNLFIIANLNLKPYL